MMGRIDSPEVEATSRAEVKVHLADSCEFTRYNGQFLDGFYRKLSSLIIIYIHNF